MALPAPLPTPPAQNTVARDGAIVAIVVHDTNTPKPNGSSLETLTTGDGRGVSIHALVNRDGSYYRLVPDTRGANHAGSPTAVLRLGSQTWQAGAINRVTLGVELERTRGGPFYPDAQLLTFGRLVNVWRAHWGALPLVLHRTIDPTRRADPVGLDVPQIEEWARQAARVDDPTAPLASTPAPHYVGRWRLTSAAWVRSAPLIQGPKAGRHVGTLNAGTEIAGELRMGEGINGMADWIAFFYDGAEAFVWAGSTERIA